LFGSGETSASGRKVYDRLFRDLSPPVRVALLETPAGFQPNSAWVAGQVADFLRKHLQNHMPQVSVVPARNRDTDFSPDDPEIVDPLHESEVIFLGPGSPTYAVRQLQDSLAWHALTANHRLGKALVMASAATIAAGAHALPVYEIYKVGEDLHWYPGLNLFGPYGLQLVFIPHWNNTEGGENLDTSRCYMGKLRFQRLLAMMPAGVNLVGIDEHTALVLDLEAGMCRVMGKGGVTLLRDGEDRAYFHGEAFAASELGPLRTPEPQADIPGDVWRRALSARGGEAVPEPPQEVLRLVEEREAARSTDRWDVADSLREKIYAFGWHVRDTLSGPELERLPRSQGSAGGNDR
jgi:hypothetical protein